MQITLINQVRIAEQADKKTTSAGERINDMHTLIGQPTPKFFPHYLISARQGEIYQFYRV